MDASITVVPDWVCEILSPTTSRHNQLVKTPYYAKIGVKHHWVVDRAAQTLMAYRLEGPHWLLLGVYSSETEARIEPFDAAPLDVSGWWV